MADPAARETDAIIAEIEDRIEIEYRQAEREIQQRLDEYLRAFRIKDRTWQVWVESGERTKDEYIKWKTGQIAVGQRWEEMRDTIATDLLNASKIAKSIAEGYMPDVYALNHDYGTYEVEHASQIDTSYTLYSREAAERIFRDNPQMLPGPGKKASQDIQDGKAKRWNNQHIQSVAIQAILQGNSIADIATRLSNAVGDSDRKAAVRNARTMMTAAQNAGRLDAYKRANNMGIKTRKQWLATLDMRTRHEHRLLDGMMADYDKPFIVEGYKIRYPGDPDAAAKLVWNCRCTLIAAVEGYESDLSDISERYNKNLEGMSYEEWKEAKAKSKDILAQEETSEAIRADYIREYRGYGGEVKSGRNTKLDVDIKKAGQKAEKATAYGNVALKAHLGVDYEGYRKLIEDSPARTLYDKWGDNAKLRWERDGGEYGPLQRRIIWDFDHHSGRNEFSVLAHEYGHHFDYMMGRAEGLTYKEVDLINDRCGADTITARPSNSDEFISAMRRDFDRLLPYLENGTIYDNIHKSQDWQNATSGVQDALDGAYSTQKDGYTVWGHGDKYYNAMFTSLKKDGKEDTLRDTYRELGMDVSNKEKSKRLARTYETASEAWANIASAVTVGGDELTAWKMYMPATLETFMQIIGEEE